MRVLLAVIASFIVVLQAGIIRAQAEWCGYALMQFPLLDSQLSVIAALTPGFDPYSSQPDTLFQRRWNVDHTQVIIEGCFSVYPTRELMISLLDGVLEETYEEIDAQLGYMLFTPELSRDIAALVVREFILQNRAAWGEE
jgi:hypothetical protein